MSSIQSAKKVSQRNQIQAPKATVLPKPKGSKSSVAINSTRESKATRHALRALILKPSKKTPTERVQFLLARFSGILKKTRQRAAKTLVTLTTALIEETLKDRRDTLITTKKRKIEREINNIRSMDEKERAERRDYLLDRLKRYRKEVVAIIVQKFIRRQGSN